MIIKEKKKLSDVAPKDAVFVKVVVDMKRKVLAWGCELHIDCADELVNDGSDAHDLWGANIFLPTGDRIDCSSLINIRPADNNRSMKVQDRGLCHDIEVIIKSLLI